MPGFPVLHCLPKFAQTHVHWVSDAIQPFSSSVDLFSCPQPFPASGSFPISQLFASGDQSIRASASVLSMNLQCWFPLGLIGLISLLAKGHARVFSSTTVQKHEFFGVQPSLWSNSHIHPYIHDYWTWLFSPCPMIVRGLCVLAAPHEPCEGRVRVSQLCAQHHAWANMGPRRVEERLSPLRSASAKTMGFLFLRNCSEWNLPLFFFYLNVRYFIDVLMW